MNNLAFLPERDTTAETIAANIRAEIARMGITDAEFAANFGLTPMSLSRRLSGGTPFTTAEVKRAATFFGVTVEALFTEQRRPRDDTPRGGSNRPGPVLFAPPTGIEPATFGTDVNRFPSNVTRLLQRTGAAVDRDAIAPVTYMRRSVS